LHLDGSPYVIRLQRSLYGTSMPGAGAVHHIRLGLPPGNNSTHGSDQDLNRLGFWLGAAAQSNADQGPDFAPPESDLLTAEHLGERVARVTQQFARGRLPAVKGLWSEASSRSPRGSWRSWARSVQPSTEFEKVRNCSSAK
jgi:hypothetical protein